MIYFLTEGLTELVIDIEAGLIELAMFIAGDLTAAAAAAFVEVDFTRELLLAVLAEDLLTELTIILFEADD